MLCWITPPGITIVIPNKKVLYAIEKPGCIYKLETGFLLKLIRMNSEGVKHNDYYTMAYENL